MIERFIYGICFLFLISYVAHKTWQAPPFKPEVIIEAPHAYKQHLNGEGVVVAVIDEGFDSSHGSLKDRFSPYRYNTSNTSRDISESIIFEKGTYQFESHGTHVTGIISRLAPHVKIIPIKVSGFGGDQAFVKALKMAASSPAHIVNISMRLSHTGREVSPNVRAALFHLAESGKLIVIAAGNEGISLLENAYTESLAHLAHDPEVHGRLLLVGASSYEKGTEALAQFSNYPGPNLFPGTQTFFITAPGVEITSTITGGHFGEKSGTSMAAPMVAGAASLLKQAFPHLKAESLAELLLKSARKISLDGKLLPHTLFGAGILNLKAALEQGMASSPEVARSL